MIEIIYVALLDEGTDAWRPASAERLADERFRLVGPMPDNETWQFEPGSVVITESRTFRDGAKARVAIARAS